MMTPAQYCTSFEWREAKRSDDGGRCVNDSTREKTLEERVGVEGEAVLGGGRVEEVARRGTTSTLQTSPQ